MSIPHARKGRHAAPARPTGRKLAVAAAALAAGATPLVCGGTAAAATAPTQRDLSALGLPALGLPTQSLSDMALPLGLPDSLGTLTQKLPLLSKVTQVGGTGLLSKQPPQVGQLVHSALPVADLVPKLAPTSGGSVQLTPHALQDGALGALTSDIAPQASELTGGLVGQATPLVSQLRQTGVPTVGDLTSGLSGTQVPVVGTVGSVTQMVPVTTVLGAESPVTGTVQELSGL
jgi:hypothetical protein